MPAVDLARFLPAWQGVGGRAARHRGLVRAVEQLAGRRRPGQRPGDAGAARPGRRLQPGAARRADRRRRGAVARPRRTARRRRLGLAAPGGHGPPDPARPLRRARADRRSPATCSTPSAVAARSSSARSPTPSAAPTTRPLTQTLWDLVWSGRLSSDTLAAAAGPPRRWPDGPPAATVGAAVHPLLRPGLDAGRAVRTATRSGRPSMPSRSGPPTAAGRWSLLPPTEPDATVRSYAPPRSCSTATAS